MANNICVYFNSKQSRLLLTDWRWIVFLTTGHWSIGRPARRLGVDYAKDCPGYGFCAQETDDIVCAQHSTSF